MDPAAQVMIAAILCGSVLMMVKLIADAFARAKRSQSLGDADEIERRLARIEHAVDAIAVEVERAGEIQRFTARLSQQPVAELRQPERHITPH